MPFISGSGPQQPTGSTATASEESTKDCVLCNVFDKGWCKPEFEAFDGCYDATKARGETEEQCMPLFQQFRSCMQKRMKVDTLVKEAMA